MKKQETTTKKEAKPSKILKAIIIIYIAYKKTMSIIGNSLPGRFLKRIYNIIAIQFCKWEAKSLHNLTGQQYYVIKVFGKIRVTSTKQINYNRRKRVLSKSLDYYKLQEIAIYKTK